MLLRARTVLPISRPPIDDGAVLISGDRITAIGRWRDLSSNANDRVTDLGEVILLPGLINAHCHLDYTRMAGQFTPTKTFPDWIKLITAAKGGLSYADFAESWLTGARMLLRTGTTSVADVESVPELLPDAWQATPLRVFSFLEMTGVKSRRDPQAILDEAVQRIESLPASRNRAGLSPHAPYSTVPELLRLSAEVARARGWHLVTHVAESDLEFKMFMDGSGELFDWLKRNGRDMSDCGLGSSVWHLERTGCLGENVLAVHANYLAPGDAELLGRRRVSVAHCPRSHAFFRHRRFPLEELTAAGVNICLGTDSLASVKKVRGQLLELSLFEEMRTFAAAFPDVSPATILSLATINGARALGLTSQLGEIAVNTFADVITIPFHGQADEAATAVVHHNGEVFASMIDGAWVLGPEARESVANRT